MINFFNFVNKKFLFGFLVFVIGIVGVMFVNWKIGAFLCVISWGLSVMLISDEPQIKTDDAVQMLNKLMGGK